MKVAILGAGTIIPDFLEACAQIKELEIYAIFGREASKEKLKRFQADYRISKIYYDYDALLADPEIDTVYVGLPNNLHYGFAKKALEHGRHTIVEKPFTSTYAQAKDLVETARANGVFVFEAITTLYLPNYEKTRALLPRLGDIRIVQLNFSQYSRRYDQFKAGNVLPVFDPKKSGGALMDLNVYNIYYTVGLFGKPKAVHYYANVERGIDTSGILVMEYPTFQSVLVGAKDCKAPLSVNVQGDKGFLHSEMQSSIYDSFFFADNNGAKEEYALNGGMPRLYYELRAFTDCVIYGDSKRIEDSNRLSLAVMEILDQARAQAGIVFGDV